MVQNINYTDEVLDLNTHGGMIHSTLKCKVPLFGQAWFDSRSLTNILSMMEMVEKYCITFISQRGCI